MLDGALSQLHMNMLSIMQRRLRESVGWEPKRGGNRPAPSPRPSPAGGARGIRAAERIAGLLACFKGLAKRHSVVAAW